MWITAEYEATTLFSLKPATATASGGRTLLVPTPFAIKMALLDAVCRGEGVAQAQIAWTWLRGLTVALRPPARVVVNNTFIKILRPRRNPAEPGSQDAGYFGKTIAYREYAYLDGLFGIGLEVEGELQAETLGRWLACINYLGKRGGFIQLQAAPQLVEALPSEEGYIRIDGSVGAFTLDSLLTQLDDTSASMTFEQADIYSGKSIRLGKERLLRHAALPYRLVSSSRGYSHYELSS